MDKFSELKAAAMAATPGPWFRSSVQFNGITTEATFITQGNKPHLASTSEKRDAIFIAAASPAVVLELLAELEAKDKRIAELERARFIAWPGAIFAPVLARIRVDVKRRDGSVSVGQSAGNVVWYHSDSPNDVVAFALAVEGDE